MEKKELSHYYKYKLTYELYRITHKEKFNYENYHKQYYEDNIEKIKEKTKLYYLAHHETMKEENKISAKKYYDANREKVLEKVKERYKINRLDKVICNICGKQIAKLSLEKHNETKVHKRNLSNNSILQFCKITAP